MVLFVSYSGVLGGAERHLLDVAGALEGERVVACPEGPLAQRAREAGLRVLPLRGRGLRLRGSAAERARAAWRLAAHAREARALVRRLEPSLTVAWGMRPALALLGRPLRGARVAYHHHERMPGPAIARAVRAAARRADLVVTTSRHAADELGVAGAVVVPPGIDVARFAAIGPPRAPDEVLVLGALVGWKRPEVAAEAAALARGRLPSLRLRFAGAPLERSGMLAELHARVAELGMEDAVEFAGEVDAVEALGRAACLLHCAEREPYGLAVLEALAAGRPVVVPSEGGPAEIADGAGRLYPAGDARAAADALVAALGDAAEAGRLAAAGRERARGFDRSVVAPRYRALFGGEHGEESGARRERSGAAASAERDGAELALVTVTHNSAPEIEALLASAARHLPGARVIVVDCASADGSVETARRGGAEVIALGENIGFGRACNRALAAVSEPVTVLVNPDVELVDDSLLALAREAARTGRLLAPLVLQPDGDLQDSVHPAPASAADLARVLMPARLRTPGARRPRRVGWAIGCCVAARTELLRELGPFDERIFLFAEDMDLGLRAAQRGVETWLWPRARIVHVGGHATHANGEPFAALARARRDVVERRLGPARARLDDAAQVATFASRIAVKRALGRPAERERRQLAAALAARTSNVPEYDASGDEEGKPR